MNCPECNDDYSYHDWAQAPFCSPWCESGRPETNETATHGEWSRHTKVDGLGHESELLQPLKKDGTINKHFVEKYGTKRIEENMKIKKEKIMENLEKPKYTARELAAENNG